VGSITMPHKRNPELSEHLVTLSRLVRGHAGVAIEGMVHEHERDGRAWKTEWVIFPEACLLTGVALAFAVRLLEGLEVDEARMRANLEAQGGYILSEPVMRLLADRIGKHAAHQAVYEATMAGLQRGVPLQEALLAHPEVAKRLDPAEIASCLDLRRALGPVADFVDRVVGAARPASGHGPAE
jgi:adenylosuccinate lyase